MKTIKSLAMAAVLGIGGVALGQGAPITGTAGVTFAPTLTTIPANTNFGIDVRIDLTGVTGVNCLGATVPVVFGGYQIAMEFDTTRLQIVDNIDGSNVEDSVAGQNGCTTLRPAQYSLPTSTSTQTGNGQGTMVFVASNGGSQTSPTGGPRCYFRILMKTKTTNVGTVNSFVRFRDLAVGPAGTPAAYKLSSAVLNCAAQGGGNLGPVDIPKNNDVTVTLVTTPVELTKFAAE